MTLSTDNYGVPVPTWEDFRAAVEESPEVKYAPPPKPSVHETPKWRRDEVGTRKLPKFVYKYVSRDGDYECFGVTASKCVNGKSKTWTRRFTDLAPALEYLEAVEVEREKYVSDQSQGGKKQAKVNVDVAVPASEPAPLLVTVEELSASYRPYAGADGLMGLGRLTREYGQYSGLRECLVFAPPDGEVFIYRDRFIKWVEAWTPSRNER